ncbi:mechanosensitive ion channel family protein [Tistrella mobilis]
MPRLTAFARPASLLRIAPVILICLFALMTAVAGQVQAQTLPGLPSSSSASADAAAADGQAEVDALIKLLEDPEGRDKLIQRLKTAGTDAASPAGEELAAELVMPFLDGPATVIANRLDALGRDLQKAAVALSHTPDELERIGRGLANERKREQWLELIVRLAAVVMAGFLLEWVVKALLSRPRQRLATNPPASRWRRAARGITLLVIDLLGIAAFAGGAAAATALVRPTGDAAMIAIAVVQANIAVRAVLAVGRVALRPQIRRLRPLPFSDETAAYLYIWLKRFARITVYGWFLYDVARTLGVSAPVLLVASKVFGLFVASLAAVVVLQNRREVADVIAGRRQLRFAADDAPGTEAAMADPGDGSAPFGAAPAGDDVRSADNDVPPDLAAAAADRAREVTRMGMATLRARLADVWHVLALAYVAVAAGIWLLGVDGGFTFLAQATGATIVILLLDRVAVMAAERVLERLFSVSDEFILRHPGIETRVNRYLSITRTAIVGFIHVFAVLALLEVWGLGGLAWLASDAGARVVGALVKIVVFVVGAAVIWEMVDGAISRRLQSDGDRAPTTRAKTLLPMLRNVIMIVLTLVVVLTVFSEIGIDIAPLLAGAGVVGLAIGFGAQTLVKDFITGAFILFEDTISVGDVVTVAGQTGAVERMTVRTIRLRDVEGVVRTVPFSAVDIVQNLTKDFSYALLDISVAYRENVGEVAEIMREVGLAMGQDPEFRDLILQPIEIFGLDRFGPSDVIVRGRIMTKPGQQWAVKRAFFARIKQAFDERGVEIPFPHTTLYFGVGKDGKAPAAPVQVLKTEGSWRSGATGHSAPKQLPGTVPPAEDPRDRRDVHAVPGDEDSRRPPRIDDGSGEAGGDAQPTR